MPCRALRSSGHLESEFLPRRGGCRTAILFRLAAHGNPIAQFPHSGSFWRIALCATPYAAKVADLSKSCGRSRLASLLFFPYAFSVKRPLRHFQYFEAEQFLRAFFSLLSVVAFACGAPALLARPQQTANQPALAVTKVEPPNWWVGLAPEVMLLLSGHDLEATHVACNLPTLRVSRTQATAGGNYLFIWLKIGADTKSGTAVCRITAPKGTTSFELPLAARAPTLGKFQGLSQDDVMYLIMPDRFANGDPTNDEPAEAPGSHDRSKPRAYHGGDLLGIQNHLPYLKDLGVTTLWLTPIVKNGAAQDYHGYGAVDLYAVDPHLGGLKDYQDLVVAAHKQGMKVFFDVVPNHIGPKHPWVSNPPLPDWFHGTLQHHIDSFSPLKGSFYGKAGGQAIGNDPFESLVDPHASMRMKRNLTEGWFFGILPDMNTENPLVEQYLLQNSIWWAEISGLDAGRIADVLRRDALYVHPDMLVPFFANHDVPRFASAEGSSPTKLKLAFGLTLTLRGVPEIYYGDEIGMPGGGDPDNRRGFPGGWIGDANDAFTQSGRTRDQQEVFAYVQSLLKLRHEHVALRTGQLWHLASDESSYVFARESEEDERIVVAFNNADQPRELRIPLADTPAQGAAAIGFLFGEAKAELAGNEIRLTMPAQSLSIFSLN